MKKICIFYINIFYGITNISAVQFTHNVDFYSSRTNSTAITCTCPYWPDQWLCLYLRMRNIKLSEKITRLYLQLYKKQTFVVCLVISQILYSIQFLLFSNNNNIISNPESDMNKIAITWLFYNLFLNVTKECSWAWKIITIVFITLYV